MGKKKYTFDISNNRLLTIAKKYDQLCIILFLATTGSRENVLKACEYADTDLENFAND